MFAFLIACGLILGLLATLAGLNRRDEVAGLGQEIRYDDFAFSVQEVRKTRTLGNSTAQGIYYIVNLKVANHATRLNFEFKPASPVLIGHDGRRYRASFEPQQAIESNGDAGDACAAPIPPGSSCVKQVVFDVPDDVSDLRLKISSAGLAGDILDTIFYGRKVIRLELNEQESMAR